MGRVVSISNGLLSLSSRRAMPQQVLLLTYEGGIDWGWCMLCSDNTTRTNKLSLI
jgi:hypothetical protein